MSTHLYRSHISFGSVSEAKAFEKQLEIISSVRDQRINDAYVDPQRFGNSIRIDIETMSDEVFSKIYNEIILHLLLGNGHSPVKDHVMKFDVAKDSEKLTLVKPVTFQHIQDLKSLN